jgi:hypothetical protein
MSNSKKRKRSRSHSQERHKRSRRADKQLQEMQEQITNLTSTVKQLVEGTERTSVLALKQSNVSSQSNETKIHGKSKGDTTH